MTNKSSTRPRRPRPNRRAGPSTVSDTRSRRDADILTERGAQHPAIKAWLARHPRFTLHHTPTYSSWLNQVERWFAYLTEDLLQRSDHRSVQALESDIRA